MRSIPSQNAPPEATVSARASVFRTAITRIASAASFTSRATDSVTSDTPARSRCAGTTLASCACGPHEPATSQNSKCYSCCTLSLSLGSVILTRGVVYIYSLPPSHHHYGGGESTFQFVLSLVRQRNRVITNSW